jgi:hypothetical protein
MNTLATTQATPSQCPPETLFAFSIGSACDLAELDREFKAWLKTPIKAEEVAPTP